MGEESDGPGEEQTETIRSNAQFRNRLITFEINGQEAFIEPLLDYADRVGTLRGGRERRLITAVMVGEVDGHAIDYERLFHWLPAGAPRALGFATGIEVGAPWLEFRDADGLLVRRLHINLDAPVFVKVRGPLDEALHGGISRMLTRFLALPRDRRTSTQVAMQHATRGRLPDQTIEDKLDSLVRGLEGLCDTNGIGRINLLQSIDSGYRDRVRRALSAAVSNLNAIMAEARDKGELDQARFLQRIAGRTSNAANDDLAFGLAVTSLLKKFELPDADVVDAYYQANPRGDRLTDWAQVIACYRGIVMHRTGFEIRTGQYDVLEIARLSSHLHDILVRIILKTVGYDGEYQATTITGTASESLGWVTSDTCASLLGYQP